MRTIIRVKLQVASDDGDTCVGVECVDLLKTHSVDVLLALHRQEDYLGQRTRSKDYLRLEAVDLFAVRKFAKLKLVLGDDQASCEIHDDLQISAGTAEYDVGLRERSINDLDLRTRVP